MAPLSRGMIVCMCCLQFITQMFVCCSAQPLEYDIRINDVSFADTTHYSGRSSNVDIEINIQNIGTSRFFVSVSSYLSRDGDTGTSTPYDEPIDPTKGVILPYNSSVLIPNDSCLEYNVFCVKVSAFADALFANSSANKESCLAFQPGKAGRKKCLSDIVISDFKFVSIEGGRYAVDSPTEITFSTELTNTGPNPFHVPAGEGDLGIIFFVFRVETDEARTVGSAGVTVDNLLVNATVGLPDRRVSVTLDANVCSDETAELCVSVNISDDVPYYNIPRVINCSKFGEIDMGRAGPVDCEDKTPILAIVLIVLCIIAIILVIVCITFRKKIRLNCCDSCCRRESLESQPDPQRKRGFSVAHIYEDVRTTLSKHLRGVKHDNHDETSPGSEDGDGQTNAAFRQDKINNGERYPDEHGLDGLSLSNPRPSVANVYNINIAPWDKPQVVVIHGTTETDTGTDDEDGARPMSSLTPPDCQETAYQCSLAPTPYPKSEQHLYQTPDVVQRRSVSKCNSQLGEEARVTDLPRDDSIRVDQLPTDPLPTCPLPSDLSTCTLDLPFRDPPEPPDPNYPSDPNYPPPPTDLPEPPPTDLLRTDPFPTDPVDSPHLALSNDLPDSFLTCPLPSDPTCYISTDITPSVPPANWRNSSSNRNSATEQGRPLLAPKPWTKSIGEDSSKTPDAQARSNSSETGPDLPPKPPAITSRKNSSHTADPQVKSNSSVTSMSSLQAMSSLQNLRGLPLNPNICHEAITNVIDSIGAKNPHEKVDTDGNRSSVAAAEINVDSPSNQRFIEAIVQNYLSLIFEASQGQDDYETAITKEIEMSDSLSPPVSDRQQFRRKSYSAQLSLKQNKRSEIKSGVYVNKWDKSWEFDRSKLEMDMSQTLGEGQFGTVYKGVAKNIRGRHEDTTVAIKVLKAGSTREDKNEFLKELAIHTIMKPHPHVVELLGCCIRDEPICIMTEYLSGGSLLNYLRKYLSKETSRETVQYYIVQFGLHIVEGMSYVAEMEIVHRDLAARNILVNDQEICKVADFGFARDVFGVGVYSQVPEKAPIRWYSPEALLDDVFSTKSDVWSFGILLFEIATLGVVMPYKGCNNDLVRLLVSTGEHPTRPPHCNDELFDIMRSCWSHKPEDRPSFKELVYIFKEIKEKYSYPV